MVNRNDSKVQVPDPPRLAKASPLSAQQQRLWFLEQLEHSGSAYHKAAFVRLEGRLDYRALQSSVHARLTDLLGGRRLRASGLGRPYHPLQAPKQPYYHLHDPALGWGSRARGGVDIQVVEIDQEELLREPYVEILGRRFGEHLQRLDAADSAVAGQRLGGCRQSTRRTHAREQASVDA